MINSIGSVIFNPTANVYNWFAAGLLFSMYHLERKDAAAARALVYWETRSVNGAGKQKLLA
jgi:hypothetical protein